MLVEVAPAGNHTVQIVQADPHIGNIRMPCFDSQKCALCVDHCQLVIAVQWFLCRDDPLHGLILHRAGKRLLNLGQVAVQVDAGLIQRRTIDSLGLRRNNTRGIVI